jgi:hypothetical protein
VLEAKALTAITLTRVVFPLFCKPTKVNSISVYWSRRIKKKSPVSQ